MIKLDENYRIENDISSWALIYEKEGELNKKGKPKLSRNVWYHSNLAACLREYLNQALKPSTSVQGVLAAITEAEARIEKAVEGIKR